MSAAEDDDRLDSWKAIARYLGRSVRTVRRWEQATGLPIHRLQHRSRASVYAYRSELDDWLRRDEPDRSAARPTGGQLPSPAAGASDAMPAIAVLPFRFAGPDRDQDWIAQGLTEEITSRLSGLRALRVTSRASAAAPEVATLDTRAIGELLGVSHLLEGSVVGDRNRLRIGVRLIDVATDRAAWSRQYDGRIDEVLDLQPRIAEEVAGRLELDLSERETSRLRAAGVATIDSWRLLLEARQLALRWRPDALDQARQLLEDALEQHGESADILATLGRVHLHYREAGIDASEGPLERATSLAERALALDPENAEARLLLGWLHYARGDIVAAVVDLRRTLESAPSNADALGLLINCYLISGRDALARPLIGRLMAIDPLTPLTICIPGYADVLVGRFEDAIPPYREMFEKDPGNPFARLFYGWVLFSAGHDDAAIDIASGYQPPLDRSAAAEIAGLFVRAAQGDLDDAALSEATRQLLHANEMFPRFVAQAYAMAGQAETATRWLRRAVERGFVNYPYLARHDPHFQRVKDDPGLRTLLDHVRRRWEAFEPDQPGAAST